MIVYSNLRSYIELMVNFVEENMKVSDSLEKYISQHWIDRVNNRKIEGKLLKNIKKNNEKILRYI